MGAGGAQPQAAVRRQFILYYGYVLIHECLCSSMQTFLTQNTCAHVLQVHAAVDRPLCYSHHAKQIHSGPKHGSIPLSFDPHVHTHGVLFCDSLEHG